MKHFISISLVLFIFLNSSAICQQSPSIDSRVDKYIEEQMAKHQIPGLVLGVAKAGKLVKLQAYGLASVEFSVPANVDTVFQLFSVSKLFAGVAVMELVGDKKLSLDAPITDFIANAPADWKEIRIRNLLSHTSGLPELQANPKFASLSEDRKRSLDPEQEIEFLKELPLKFKPGEKWAYHVSGYHLLSYIIEKVSGMTYERFLQTRVFHTLGMSATRFGGTEMAIIKGRSSTSYSRQNGELRGWIYPFSVRDYPAAGLNSTAADLARFLIALDAGEVVTNESREQLWSPAKLNDGSVKKYGLGWDINEYKGRRVVGHEGGGAIWVAHFPVEHLSIIVLTNLNGSRADEIQFGVADFYLQ